MRRPGVYIHIPFCASKCAYCSFYSIPDISRAEDYLSALLREMELRSGGWQSEFGSVYIGGGTPSILPPDSVPRLLDALRESLRIATDCEISCEANPDSFTAEHAKAWASAGVNRVSIGLQSADESMLRVLSRIHGAGQFLRAVGYARGAGIDNINGDMIFGVPGQSVAMLDETMRLLHSAEVRHISCYGLQLEEGTPLYRSVSDGSLALPDEDTVGHMYEHIKAVLPTLGYMRYEISNFARTGHECLHNLNYWDNGEYLALGAAAAGAVRVEDNAAACAYDENPEAAHEARKCVAATKEPPTLITGTGAQRETDSKCSESTAACAYEENLEAAREARKRVAATKEPPTQWETDSKCSESTAACAYEENLKAAHAAPGDGIHMYRYNNPSDIDEYIANTMLGRLAALKPIPRDEEMFESVMLATRTTHGLQLDDFAQRYGTHFLRRYEKAAGKCLAAGLAVVEDGCFRLTERGMDIQNSVLLQFMDYH